ncbi:MAG: hypothetical protein HYV33_04790 [Candidatus Kerfeldbacteria bacterium]|nr:hypothetical protein [Candidatus Kerfeldbacteria bacterium]
MIPSTSEVKGEWVVNNDRPDELIVGYLHGLDGDHSIPPFEAMYKWLYDNVIKVGGRRLILVGNREVIALFMAAMSTMNAQHWCCPVLVRGVDGDWVVHVHPTDEDSGLVVGQFIPKTW